jgi:hypothetical protein
MKQLIQNVLHYWKNHRQTMIITSIILVIAIII